MNKSHSEPISISHVAPYSQSDALLHDNTIPHKNSVINFKAYLIEKPKITGCPEQMSERFTSISQQTTNTNSMCSQSVTMKTASSTTKVLKKSHTETKLCNRVPPMIQKVNRCNSCPTDDDASGHDMVLQVKPAEDRVDIKFRKRDSKRDSNVSVPYAIPNKWKDNDNCGECAMPPTGFPEDEYYFCSNLSDKMSDYEDIWKYADPKSCKVYADIKHRLQPNVFKPSRSPTSEANSSFEFHSHDIFTGQCHSEKQVVKDLNVSLDKLNGTTTKECSSNKSRTVTCSQSATRSTQSSSVTKKQISKSKCKTEVQIQHNTKVAQNKSTVTKYSESKNVCHGFNTIHEQESDLDTDSNYSNSGHSDGDMEADTEDCEEDEPRKRPGLVKVTPVWKQKSGLKGPRKSVSTSSLATMKNPVYSVPFDAISPDIVSSCTDTKGTKKRRRQSAPALSSEKIRHPSSECAKLSPLLCEETRSDTGTIDDELEEKSFSADNELNKSTDGEEVFSLELKQPKKKDLCKEEKKSSSVETKWVESTLFCSEDRVKSPHEKPKPSPRKPKAIKPNLIQQAVMNDKYSKSKKTVTAHSSASKTVIEQFQFLEEFGENSNPSSPTVAKFPVHNGHTTEGKQSHYDSTCVLTAEDIITLSNPHLVLPVCPGFPTSAPQSEYDNLNGTYIAPSGQSMMSNGTVFQQPWEQGMVAHIMKINDPVFPAHIPMTPPPVGPAPPPLPTLDPNERIKKWQESSQKYAPCVQQLENMDNEHQRSMTPECSPNEAVSFEYSTTSILEHQVSSNGKNSQSVSDRTVVNEKSTTRNSGERTEKIADYLSGMGSSFKERIMPVLGKLKI